MHLGNICQSTQEHAPQKVQAYAYTMHGSLGQPVCTPRPSSRWPLEPFSDSEWAVIVYHAFNANKLLAATQIFLELRGSAQCVRLAIEGMSSI